MPLIDTAFADDIGTLVLNHPDRRNVLSHGLIDDVCQALGEMQACKARAVVLRALPGSRVWSAGYDIDELPNAGRDPLAWGDSLRLLVRAIQSFPAPVLGLIEGGVWGGACELALACDVLVATPAATFTITPAKLGIPYNFTGLLTLANTLPLAVVKEMLFTAQPIPAAQALNIGMINHIKPAEEIEAFVYGLARRIAANAPLSVAVMKEELRLLAGAQTLSPDLFERVQTLRRAVYDSADYQEGLTAFREKRKPSFRGS